MERKFINTNEIYLNIANSVGQLRESESEQALEWVLPANKDLYKATTLAIGQAYHSGLLSLDQARACAEAAKVDVMALDPIVIEMLSKINGWHFEDCDLGECETYLVSPYEEQSSEVISWWDDLTNVKRLADMGYKCSPGDMVADFKIVVFKDTIRTYVDGDDYGEGWSIQLAVFDRKTGRRMTREEVREKEEDADWE